MAEARASRGEGGRLACLARQVGRVAGAARAGRISRPHDRPGEICEAALGQRRRRRRRRRRRQRSAHGPPHERSRRAGTPRFRVAAARWRRWFALGWFGGVRPGGAAADARGRCGQDGRRLGPSQRRLRRFRRDGERDTKHSRRRFRWTLGFALGEDLDCRAARRLCQHFFRLRVGVRSRSCQQRQRGRCCCKSTGSCGCLSTVEGVRRSSSVMYCGGGLGRCEVLAAGVAGGWSVGRT